MLCFDVDHNFLHPDKGCREELDQLRDMSMMYVEYLRLNVGVDVECPTFPAFLFHMNIACSYHVCNLLYLQ
jgi:hypothetical protein